MLSTFTYCPFSIYVLTSCISCNIESCIPSDSNICLSSSSYKKGAFYSIDYYSNTSSISISTVEVIESINDPTLIHFLLVSAGLVSIGEGGEPL